MDRPNKNVLDFLRKTSKDLSSKNCRFFKKQFQGPSKKLS